MRSLELIVVNVGEEKKSSINEFKYHFIVLKSTDLTDKTKYVLNLQKRDDTEKGLNNYNNWIKNLAEGAVIQAVMQERNPRNIDQWKEFKVIKKAHEAPIKKDIGKPIEKQEDAFKLSLGAQLQKLEDSYTASLHVIKQIKADFDL